MKSNAKFKMIDEEFICGVCNEVVKPLKYTARDHCPKCLSSKHVDINPGDRSSDCHGTLVPVGILPDKKNEYKIVFQCNKCHMIKRNKIARDDNYDVILKLSSNPVDIQ